MEGDDDRQPFDPSHAPPTDLFDRTSGGNCPVEFFIHTVSGLPLPIQALFQSMVRSRRMCDCSVRIGADAAGEHLLSETHEAVSVLSLPLPDGDAGQSVAIQDLLSRVLVQGRQPRPSENLCRSACSVACAKALHTRLNLPTDQPVTIADVEALLLTKEAQLGQALKRLEPLQSQIDLWNADIYEPGCSVRKMWKTGEKEAQVAKLRVLIDRCRLQMASLFDPELHTTVALAVEVKNNFLASQVHQATLAVASHQPQASTTLALAERALADFARTCATPLAPFIKEAAKELPRGRVTEYREYDPLHPPQLLVIQLSRLEQPTFGDGKFQQRINDTRVTGIKAVRFLECNYTARAVALKNGSKVGKLHYSTAVEYAINGATRAFHVDNFHEPHVDAINRMEEAKETFETDACVILYERRDANSRSVVDRVVEDAAPLPGPHVLQQVCLLLLDPLFAACISV